VTSGAAIRRELLPALPLAAFFLLFFAAPLLMLLGVSFFTDNELKQPTLAQYAKFLGDSFNWSVLFETLVLGLEVTVLCIVLAFPLGLYYLEASERVRSLIIFVIIVPLLTSAVVRTFAWIVILGREGIVNNSLLQLGLASEPLKLLYTTGGVVVALAQIQLPLMALPVINSLLRIDPSLMQASRGLGAGRWRTFWKVLLPLTAPGLIAGALLVFAASVTAFITQSLVGGGRLVFMPVFIYQQAVVLQNWPFAATISVVFMAAVMLIVYGVNQFARSRLGGMHAA
jgi:putative spermidine/putrescine transport system permease protein